LRKVRLILSRKANDHIHADRAMRQQALDLRHPLRIQIPAVPPAHRTQYLVAPALQRDVEMRHELLRGSNRANDVLRQEIGLNGRDAEAIDAGAALQREHELEEAFLPAAAS